MSDLESIEAWLKDLRRVIADHRMADDATTQQNLSLAEIELDSLRITLPDAKPEQSVAIFALRRAKIAGLVTETLQHVVGYYALVDRRNMDEHRKGENEPPIGSVLADVLSQQLVAAEVDVFAVKNTLAAALDESLGSFDP